MANEINEKKIELFVVFQEKLALKMHDSDFRRDVLEPLLYSGATDESLDTVINIILEDEEIKQLVSTINDSNVKADLKILLKKLVERFSKFSFEEKTDNYIG